MLSNPFYNPKLNSYGRAGIALAFSVLLHLIVFKGTDWHWPLPNNEPSLIVAELVIPADGKDKSTSIAPKQPSSRLSSHTPKPKAQPTAPPDLPTPDAPKTSDAVSSTPSIAEDSQGRDAQTESKAKGEVTVTDEAVPSDIQQPLAPQYVSMEYDVTQGPGTGSLASTQVIYQKKDEGNYTLRSETQAHGLASLFLSGNLVQTSIGKITESGLKPDYYSYEFGSDTNKYQHANFDWEASQLTMHTKKGDKAVPLPPGTQDFLSFMYQYMFVPPLTQMELSMTNGKKLSHYVYTFEGEESVNTKLGDLRSLHIAKSRGESEEKTELWLAIDYHYLPIKIRMTEKGGKLYEQNRDSSFDRISNDYANQDSTNHQNQS